MSLDTVKQALEMAAKHKYGDGDYTAFFEKALAELAEYMGRQNTQNTDYVYNVDDWEVTYESIHLLEEEFSFSSKDIMRVGRLKSLPQEYMIKNYQDGEDECFDSFDTEAEARAAINIIKGKANGQTKTCRK